MVLEVCDAMDMRYKQLVANFLFDRVAITPFGGEWDATMCRVENLFKEISNRSLAAKHALWKGDLWLADDLTNDNYFTALDARAEIEANQFAVHTRSNAYWDKRRSASIKASSVIADIIYTTAKQSKACNDFYAKSVPGIDLTTGTTGIGGGSSSSSSSSGYGQALFRGRYPHTNDTPNQPVLTGTTGGVRHPYRTATRAGKRYKKPVTVEESATQDSVAPTPNPQDTTALPVRGGGGGRRFRGKYSFTRGGGSFDRGGGGVVQPNTTTTPNTDV
jgi:hypothetical protein